MVRAERGGGCSCSGPEPLLRRSLRGRGTVLAGRENLGAELCAKTEGHLGRLGQGVRAAGWRQVGDKGDLCVGLRTLRGRVWVRSPGEPRRSSRVWLGDCRKRMSWSFGPEAPWDSWAGRPTVHVLLLSQSRRPFCPPMVSDAVTQAHPFSFICPLAGSQSAVSAGDLGPGPSPHSFAPASRSGDGLCPVLGRAAPL